MSNPLGDRNLLVGILAWQKKFIGSDVLLAAMNAWTLAKEKGLAQILREHKALTENQHALLEEAVFEHLSRHGNDVHKSLATLRFVDPIKQTLAQIADADLRASLAQVAMAEPTVEPAELVAEAVEVVELPKKRPTPVTPVQVAAKKSAAPRRQAKTRARGGPVLVWLAGCFLGGGFAVMVATVAIVLAVVLFPEIARFGQGKPADDPIHRGKELDQAGDKPPPIEEPVPPKDPPPDPEPPADPLPPDIPAKPAPLAVTEGFVPLFNGKDLTGWKTRSNLLGDWRVLDGVLTGSAPTLGYLVSTRDDYQDFHLLVEARLDDQAGSGGQLELRGPADRQRGYEIYLHPPPRAAGVLLARRDDLVRFGQGGGSKINLGEWFTLEAIAEGNRVRVLLNGKPASEFVDNKNEFTESLKGCIALRHSANAKLEFRKIEIKELKAAAPLPIVVDKDFVPLFNGKDLTGWRTPPTQPGDWRVKDGILSGSGAFRDTLYTTRADFKDYHLRLETRINNGGRASIYCRGPFGPVQPEANPLFPIGFQTEICNTPTELNRTGGVNIRYMTGVTGRNYHSFLAPGEWFTFEILAVGNRVSTKINGKPAQSMVDNDRMFLSGTIGLFLGRAGTVLEFRKIEIKELEPVALAPLPPKEMPGKDAAPFAAEDGFVSLFNGKDLTGWLGTVKESWRVVNGVLTGSGGGNLRFITTPRDDYGDFHLRLETRLNDDGNGTVAFRYPYDLAEVKNMRIAGYALRLTNFPTDPGKTGSLMVHEKTDTRNLIVKERLVPPGTWFNLEIIAKGNQVDVLINGQKANSFLNPKTHLMGGRIVLGYADNFNRRTVVEYRKIEIKEFKAVAAPPQPAPVRPLEAFAAIFNGKDLTGWRVEGKEAWKVNEASELVGTGPDTAILTKRADYRNLIAKIELTASADVEAYFGFRESQAPGEKVLGLTTWLTGEGALVRAGRIGTDGTTLEVGNPRIKVNAGERFVLEIHVTPDSTRISVNSTVSSGVSYPLEKHPPGAIGLHIVKGTVRIKKFEVSAEPSVAPPR